MNDEVDYVLVGGGLQSGLIALALRANQPDARIALVERAPVLGGNHTWCFHARDLAEDMRSWIDPLVTVRWTGHDVAFPGFRRTVASPYSIVTSPRLAEQVTRALDVEGSELLTSTVADEVAADHVVVRSGRGPRTLRAAAVIDARGPAHYAVHEGGWQKFVGQELIVEGHDVSRPMLMDATIEQRDGFRFMYVLPLAPDRLLVEDTYVSDSAFLDVAAIRREIGRYCAMRGWDAQDVVREESGVLPLPSRAETPRTTAPLVAGYAGGWFHPATGYSFPVAARLARFISMRAARDLHGAALDAFANEHARQMRFALQLNHMLFRWFRPDDRHHALARFYKKLPDDAIERFYALDLTARDRARLLVGAPPRGMSWRAAMTGRVPS